MASWEQTVLRLVQESEELSEYVSQLEAASDESAGEERMAGQQVPSGESIADELERFLRERDQGGSGA